MSIIDLPADQFSPSDVLLHLKNNTPCVIRNVLSPESIQMYLNSLQNETYMDATILEKNNYLNAYQSDPDLIHAKKIRVGKHKTKHITKWNYNSNGAEVLHILLQGKKNIYLSPPQSLPVYPFSTIAWGYDFKGKHMVEIKAGDILFLPSYWFHKVVTLKDSTTINYIMYHKNNNHSSIRDKELFGLHGLFNTPMDQEIISVHKNENTLLCVARGLYEMFLFISIFLILYFIGKKTKQRWVIHSVLLLGCAIGLYFYYNKELSMNTNGITQIVGFYTLFITALFFIYDWNEHQSDYIIF